MIKYVILLTLIAGLAGCAPEEAGSATLAPELTPSSIATEKIFALTKVVMLTSEVETQMAVSPKNNATITAILETKSAGATQMAETITAEPTGTPTPPIPSDSPLCASADLKPFSFSNGATGNVLLSVVLTNISSKPCYLQAWPQAILVDENGKPIDVDHSYRDQSTGNPASAQTEKIGLLPAWEARFDLLWFDSRTWCGKPISSNLRIHLTLMNNAGTVEIPTDLQPGTTCDSPGTRTSINITKFYLAPPH